MLLIPLILLGPLLRLTGSWIPTLIYYGALFGDIFLLTPFLIGSDCNGQVTTPDLEPFKIDKLFVQDSLNTCDEGLCLFPLLYGQVDKVEKEIGAQNYIFYWQEGKCNQVTGRELVALEPDGVWPLRRPGKCLAVSPADNSGYIFKSEITRRTEHFGARQVADVRVESKTSSGWSLIYAYRRVETHLITPFSLLLADISERQCTYLLPIKN